MRDEDKTKDQLIKEIFQLRELTETLKNDKEKLCTALSEEKRKFRLYVDKSPDGIFVTDRNGSYVDVNQAACLLLGYTREELLQLKISDISYLKVGVKFFEKLKETGELLKRDTVLIRKDCSKLNVELKAVSLENDYYMAYAADITERKLAEIKLRDSEGLFSKAFHSNPNSMAIKSLPEGKYIDVNESFLRIHEFSRDEVIGNTGYDLKIWPDVRKQKQLPFEKDGKVNYIDIELYNKSGKKLTGVYSLERIELNGKLCAVGCFTDLTEKKNIEEEMSRLDRLNLIGEMSASIGHEVRNPMTTVKGFLQLMAIKETDTKKRIYYELMIEELDRANAIITEFLSLAKDKAVKLQPGSLNKLINTLFPLLSSDAINQDKRIVLSKGDIPNILIDDKEIRQLIINLVKNGLEAMQPGGTLKIGTYCKANEVVLFVEDEGPGIKPEILEKLGNPFVTTKDTGTGLGLAVSYSIAKRHNATIDVLTGSTGTTFYARFKMNANQNSYSF